MMRSQGSLRVAIILFFLTNIGSTIAQNVNTFTTSFGDLGIVSITVNADSTELCYAVNVVPGTVVQEIHLHAPNGTIAATLGIPGSSGQSSGCFGVQLSLIDDMVNNGGYVVDIHSTSFTNGEVQGGVQDAPSISNPSSGGGGDTGRIQDDGRLLTSLTPIYVRQTGIQVLTDHGYVLFNVTEQEIDAYSGVSENTIILEQGDIVLYKLASGGYQLNIGPDESGAVQVNIIKEIPTRISTREDFNVYDVIGQ